MDIVASAKGSPMMCPKLNFPARRFSIMLYCFSSDGEFWDLEDCIEEGWVRSRLVRSVMVAAFVTRIVFCMSNALQRAFS
jgi:hypothetical protein